MAAAVLMGSWGRKRIPRRGGGRRSRKYNSSFKWENSFLTILIVTSCLLLLSSISFVSGDSKYEDVIKHRLPWPPPASAQWKRKRQKLDDEAATTTAKPPSTTTEQSSEISQRPSSINDILSGLTDTNSWEEDSPYFLLDESFSDEQTTEATDEPHSIDTKSNATKVSVSEDSPHVSIGQFFDVSQSNDAIATVLDTQTQTPRPSSINAILSSLTSTDLGDKDSPHASSYDQYFSDGPSLPYHELVRPRPSINAILSSSSFSESNNAQADQISSEDEDNSINDSTEETTSEDSTVATPESNRRTGLHFGDKYVSIDQFFREREGKEQDLTAQESIRPRPSINAIISKYSGEATGGNTRNEIEERGKTASRVEATLNVSSKDSPYALIDTYFPDRSRDYASKASAHQRAVAEGRADRVDGVEPDEVWLSDGGLLVLKGGMATGPEQGTGGAWEPLDDWEAPYREPKLPPPDFVPNDTGVGVPLPPEDPEGPVEPQRNEIKSLKSPAKVKSLPPPPPLSPNFHDFIFDEERHISEVENFHSVRKAQQEEFFRNRFTSPSPLSIPPTERPSLVSSRPQLVSTTPLTPIHVTSTPSYYFHTSTPDSYSYAFQSPVDPFHGNSVIENTTPRPLWEHGSPQVVEHNTVLPYRPSPHPIKPIHTTTTTTAEPPVPVRIRTLPDKVTIRELHKQNHKKQKLLKLKKKKKYIYATKFRKSKAALGGAGGSFGLKLPKFMNKHIWRAQHRQHQKPILSNEVIDNHVRRRVDHPGLVRHRQVRKLKSKSQHHHQPHHTPEHPFIRELRAKLTENKRRLFRSWREAISSERLSGVTDSATVASKAIKRLVPVSSIHSSPPQSGRGLGSGYHPQPRAPRQQRGSFGSSVRRNGGGYTSFFCGGEDCRSWGYSYRS